MLTPIDIQNHTLKTSMSGYNKKDTEEFLASILDSYETLFKENRTLKEKITSLSEGIQYYKQMENTLQKALILAEKTSTETQEAAKAQADSVIKDAKAQADSIIKDTQAEADNTKAEAETAIKEAEEKTAALVKEAEEKAAALVKEAEKKAADVTGKAEASAETITMEAEKKAETVLREAETKAALMVSEAKKQTSDIKSQAQDELDKIRISAIKIVQDYENYCNQVRKFATAQLSLLESDDYKLQVTEFNIDNIVTKDNSTDLINDSIEEDTSTSNIAYIGEVNPDMPEPDKGYERGSSDTGKFSWNNDEKEYPAVEEVDNANPFTFIDPE